MAKNASSEDFKVLEGSMEHLNLETAPLASSHNDKSDDDDTDSWCEDETSNDVKGGGLRPSSALDREWKLRHKKFHTMGYRDGITAGKEASAQEGFSVGFKQSAHNGFSWGLVRGTSNAYANLPDHLKEKLVETAEKRDGLQNIDQIAQMISTTDALKMYHESIQSSDSSSKSSIRSGKGSGYNQMDILFKD